ncbi:hypothetical protein AGMMS50256_21830 [Betaproteobacteria bacterium]|nr:hypothetical protein AGMMS50256_21830 [Betaproteobacteria bacterium]
MMDKASCGQGNRMNIFVMVKHEQAFAFPLPLWERVPRQGRVRGCLDMFQPCFALNRRPLSCAFTKIRGILPHEGGGG